jgi:lysozyme
MMRISKKGLEFLKKEEGVRLKAYKDSRGLWTIGVGHLMEDQNPKTASKVVWTMDQAMEQLDVDLDEAEDAVNRLVHVDLDQNEFDALCSLVFNIGETQFRRSTLLKKLNAEDRAGAAQEFLKWKRAGKKKDVLLPRRQREKALFMRHVAPAPLYKDPKVIGSGIGGAATATSLIAEATDSVSNAIYAGMEFQTLKILLLVLVIAGIAVPTFFYVRNWLREKRLAER